MAMRDEAAAQGAGLAYQDEAGWGVSAQVDGVPVVVRGISAEEVLESLRAGLESAAKARGVLPRLTADRTVVGLLAALEGGAP